MILLRTITAGLTLRNVMPSRSKMPIPAPVVTDWIQKPEIAGEDRQHDDADDQHGEDRRDRQDLHRVEFGQQCHVADFHAPEE